MTRKCHSHILQNIWHCGEDAMLDNRNMPFRIHQKQKNYIFHSGISTKLERRQRNIQQNKEPTQNPHKQWTLRQTMDKQHTASSTMRSL